MQYYNAIRVNSVFYLYAMYESVRGVYDSVGATYRFFYGVYGVVCGIFRIVHGSIAAYRLHISLSLL